MIEKTMTAIVKFVKELGSFCTAFILFTCVFILPALIVALVIKILFGL